MRSIRAALLVSCLGVLGATGCADLRVGRPVNDEKVQEIVPGQTTIDDVHAWFGNPYRTVQGPDGTILVYRWMPGTGTVDDLIISMNGDTVCTFSQER